MDLREKMRKDALEIIEYAISRVLPDSSVKEALENLKIESAYLVAIGKAAWRMAKAAKDVLGDRIIEGIVITKYGHSEGEIEGIEVFEAGHPLPDENTLIATERAIKLAEKLRKDDVLLFMVSGGGSALFEKPLPGVTLGDIIEITDNLMKAGADIKELNTVRKHLSSVKGGRLAQIAYPARVISLVLSDVLGDPLDMIASGPTYPDTTTSENAREIIEKYGLKLDESVMKALSVETPKTITNAMHMIIGNLEKACRAAVSKATELGYNTFTLTMQLIGEARHAGKFITSIAKDVKEGKHFISRPAALVFGGETTVTVTGKGIGGRNQEIALSSALEIGGVEGIVIASVGTDGTDGPTDAAGGIVDWKSTERMKEKGIDPLQKLKDNDSYSALKSSGDLLITGPTGTNVNDIIITLVR